MESGFVLGDHRFKNFGDGQTRKVRNHSRGGERETEPYQIMGGFADHGLIEVADLDFETAVGVGNRAQMAQRTLPHLQHHLEMANMLDQRKK